MTRRSSLATSRGARLRRACPSGDRAARRAARGERSGCEQLRPCGRELERQVAAVEARTELGDGSSTSRSGTDRVRACHEERHRPPLSARGGRSSSVSPWMRSGFPTRHRRAAAPVRGLMSSRERLAAAGSRCSRLSHDDVRASSRPPVRRSRPPRARSRPEPLRDRRQHEIGLPQWCERAEDRPTLRVLGEQPASSRAKRVLPVPPGPSTLNTRGSRSYTSDTASNSSCSRPRKSVAGVGSSIEPRRAKRRECVESPS